MKIIGNTKEFIQLSELDSKPCTIFDNPEPSSLTILWFKTDDNHFVIDGEDYTFARNQIVFLTEFHKVKALTKGDSNFLRFNRSFYCIIDHDAEVSCKGILFFGASQLPVITTPDEKFDALVKLTKQITLNKGRVDDATLEAFFEAGYTKGSLVDVILAISGKIVMNYLHNLTQVEIDFPIAQELEVVDA